jgi:CPA2 family monovalent cation:H+ antiporter-2
MLESVAKLAFFLTLWFVAGIFLLPTFLKRTRRFMNDEMMLIVSLALCLLMVVLAVKVGFSPALGAFIMGSILAETIQGERIERLVKSVKDLFGAVFFVSVGMLIDPKTLIEYAGPVLIIAFVTIAGIFISTTAGSLISGQTLKHSVQTGMSLAQIGEFSFIIATLGLTLGVTSDFLYSIAVAVSALTAFTTPYMIRLATPFYLLLEKKLPSKWIMVLNRYSSSSQNIHAMSDWRILLRSYVYSLLIHSVIIIAIILLSVNYLNPFINESISNSGTGRILTAGITIIVLTPFIWALSIRRIQLPAYSRLWLNKKYSKGPLLAMEALRIILGIVFIGLFINLLYSAFIAVFIALAAAAFVMIYFRKRLQSFYSSVEERFMKNLRQREEAEKKKLTDDIIPWDGHIAEFILPPESKLIGKSLKDLAIREKYGVNIALIERGKLTIATPSRDEVLYPGDVISVIGTDEQLAHIKPLIESEEISEKDHWDEGEPLVLRRVTVHNRLFLNGMTIRSSGIREDAKALVVGIERNGERILNPDSSHIFEDGDTVFLVGNDKLIKRFLGKKVNK